MFKVVANSDHITVTKGDKFRIELSPNEVAKATHLLGIALSMGNMDTVPSHIADNPFVVRFFQDGLMAFERRDREGSVPFKQEDGDDLIKVLQSGLQLAINERTLVQGPRGIHKLRTTQF